MILNAIFSQDKITSLLGLYGRFWPSLVGVLSLGGFYFLLTNNVQIRENESEPEKEIQLSSIIKAFFWSSSLVVLMTYFSLFGLWAKISNYLLSEYTSQLHRVCISLKDTLK